MEEGGRMKVEGGKLVRTLKFGHQWVTRSGRGVSSTVGHTEADANLSWCRGKVNDKSVTYYWQYAGLFVDERERAA